MLWNKSQPILRGKACMWLWIETERVCVCVCVCVCLCVRGRIYFNWSYLICVKPGFFRGVRKKKRREHMVAAQTSHTHRHTHIHTKRHTQTHAHRHLQKNAHENIHTLIPTKTNSETNSHTQTVCTPLLQEVKVRESGYVYWFVCLCLCVCIFGTGPISVGSAMRS